MGVVAGMVRKNGSSVGAGHKVNFDQNQVETDSDGVYLFSPGLPTGTYNISVDGFCNPDPSSADVPDSAWGIDIDVEDC